MSHDERPEISRFARLPVTEEETQMAANLETWFSSMTENSRAPYMRTFREYFKDENKNAYVPGAERVPPIRIFNETPSPLLHDRIHERDERWNRERNNLYTSYN